MRWSDRSGEPQEGSSLAGAGYLDLRGLNGHSERVNRAAGAGMGHQTEPELVA
jgi:hypothetical protein